MTIAVLLPRGGVQPEILTQQVESFATNFPDAKPVRYFADPAEIAHLTALLPGRAIEPITGQQVDCREVVVFEPMGNPPPAALFPPPGTKVSFILWCGRKMPLERTPAAFEREMQHANVHVFNRLAPRELYGFYYFPYGYLFRYEGLGPLDRYGFRITESLDGLAERPPNHKLIACFGGSACWSMYALHHQTYTEVLERRLNRHCEEHGLGQRFTVLNFGQHGHMVMNQIITYMLFAQALRPDYVIAHDGYNDLVFGQLCDPVLVGDALQYQENLEGWSQILHKTTHLPRTQNALPYRAVNQPIPVLKAYVQRKRQFADMVTKDGGQFIWGLQSAACSKKQRHPVETIFYERRRNKAYAPVTAGIEGLYDQLGRNLKLPPQIPFVNLHQEMQKHGADELLIGDDVHLTPGGDRVIAEAYARPIIESLKPA